MDPRAEWTAMADRLLAAVVPYAAPGYVQYRLPGRTSRSGVESDGLEGFARTFLLAAFRAATDRGHPALPRYVDGLANGTDPTHPYAWTPITDRHQTIVEAASIALALHETREFIFDELAQGAQERVVAWLAGVVGKHVWPCNWVLFKVIVEQFLKNVGGPYNQAEIDGHLADVEGWYRGDGWYTDGDGQNYDYYCGWAMHLYTLWWARMAAADGSVYRARLRQFLDGYQHFFGGNGSPIHQGRSLTYRVAAVAPLWLGALFDATPLPPARTRRLATGALRHFADRGAPDEQGLLRLGWHRPFLPVTQAYSGPASPYWASKGFLGLLLPPGHPVWSAPDESASAQNTAAVRVLPAPGWLLHRTTDGIVRLINHGSDHNNRDVSGDDPHYAKFAYSTHSAPESSPEAFAENVDGHLTVLRPGGAPTRRRRIDRLAAADRFAASRYVDGDIVVESASVISDDLEIRVHRVTAPPGSLIRDGGYAVAGDEPPGVTVTEASASAVAGGLTSTIHGLYGWAGAHAVQRSAANALGPCSATPYLLAAGHPGGSVLYVSAVTLAAAIPAAPPRPPVVSVEGDTARWHAANGDRFEVRLGRTPAYRRFTMEGDQVAAFG